MRELSAFAHDVMPGPPVGVLGHAEVAGDLRLIEGNLIYGLDPLASARSALATPETLKIGHSAGVFHLWRSDQSSHPHAGNIRMRPVTGTISQ